jgi:hypothetical protein
VPGRAPPAPMSGSATGQGPAMNVTGSTADLAVELVGNGRNATFPVPEHGTVMLVGIFFDTKRRDLFQCFLRTSGRRFAVLPEIPGLYPSKLIGKIVIG